MRTDEFVALLAAGPVAVEQGAVSRRYAAALGWGGFGSAVLMALFLGVRPDVVAAAALPMFWVKLAFPVALAAGALVASVRLATPGRVLGRTRSALVAPLLVIWLMAAVTLAGAAPDARLVLLLGSTWTACPFSIALLSLPVFVAALRTMRGLAPTRLVLAGAASGLLAGAIAAAIYALHCTEMEAPFLATWYVAGMLIPTAVGAVLGPLLLRW